MIPNAPPVNMPDPGAEGVVYLVDLTDWADRAWHVVKPERTAMSGRRCEVVKTCAHALVHLLNDFAPAYVCAAVDAPFPTWRHDLHPAYKARHPAKGSDYQMQFRWTRELFALHAIPVLEIAGYEAEDVIAALTLRARRLDLQVVIVGRHRTLCSLVHDPDVRLWHDRDRRVVDHAAVVARFGVPPGKLLDALALAGHADDGIPGVRGLGAKTAAELLAPEAFGSLDGLLARAKEIPQPKRREALLTDAEDARLSRELLRLAVEVPVELDLPAMALGGFETQALTKLYLELDLGAYAERVESLPKAPVDAALLRRAAGLEEALRDAEKARSFAERMAMQPKVVLPPLDELRAFWALSAARFLPRPPAAPPMVLPRPLRRGKAEQLSLFAV